MAKKKSLKMRAMQNITREQVLWVVIISLVILLALAAAYIFKTTSIGMGTLPVTRPLTNAEEERSQDRVNEIEERRYEYPVIDVKENRVYIPEARIYVPLSADSRDLRYEMWGDTIWLSLSIAVGRQTGNNDASCDRVVIFTPSPEQARGYIAAGTIRSQDGSTRYIFRHPACDIYGDDFSKSLANVAKEIQYY